MLTGRSRIIRIRCGKVLRILFARYLYFYKVLYATILTTAPSVMLDENYFMLDIVTTYTPIGVTTRVYSLFPVFESSTGT
jgi:hypothetical protein